MPPLDGTSRPLIGTDMAGVGVRVRVGLWVCGGGVEGVGVDVSVGVSVSVNVSLSVSVSVSVNVGVSVSVRVSKATQQYEDLFLSNDSSCTAVVSHAAALHVGVDYAAS